jgi:hypothetical protein
MLVPFSVKPVYTAYHTLSGTGCHMLLLITVVTIVVCVLLSIGLCVLHENTISIFFPTKTIQIILVLFCLRATLILIWYHDTPQCIYYHHLYNTTLILYPMCGWTILLCIIARPLHYTISLYRYTIGEDHVFDDKKKSTSYLVCGAVAGMWCILLIAFVYTDKWDYTRTTTRSCGCISTNTPQFIVRWTLLGGLITLLTCAAHVAWLELHWCSHLSAGMRQLGFGLYIHWIILMCVVVAAYIVETGTERCMNDVSVTSSVLFRTQTVQTVFDLAAICIYIVMYCVVFYFHVYTDTKRVFMFRHSR